MIQVLSYCIFEIKNNPLCNCEGLGAVTRNYGGNIVTGDAVPLDLSMQFQAWQPLRTQQSTGWDPNSEAIQDKVYSENKEIEKNYTNQPHI